MRNWGQCREPFKFVGGKIIPIYFLNELYNEVIT